MELIIIIQQGIEYLDKHSSLVTAIATIVLACLTYKYIQEIRRDRKKGTIYFIVREVFYPLYLQLEKDVKALELNRFEISVQKWNNELKIYFVNINEYLTYLEKEEYSLHRSLIPKYFKFLFIPIGRCRDKIEEINERYHKLLNEIKNYLQTNIDMQKLRQKTDYRIRWINENDIEDSLGLSYEVKDRLNEKRKKLLKILKNYRDIVQKLIEEWQKEYGLRLPRKREIEEPIGVGLL